MDTRILRTVRTALAIEDAAVTVEVIPYQMTAPVCQRINCRGDRKSIREDFARRLVAVRSALTVQFPIR